MAVYHQTRATIQGQNHQPPLDQTHWTPPTTHVPPQDIPQDPRWYDPNAPQDTPPLSTPPGAPIHDEAWAYGVLHVHPTATREQIENAFRAFVVIWHPDTAQSLEERAEKETHMKELNEAIAILRKAKPNTP